MAEKKNPKRKSPDAALKRLVEHPDCFCDVVNYFLQEGERITPDQLEMYDDKYLFHDETGLKKTERDVVKAVKGIGAIRVVIGVENQCYEDEGLPMRLMCYDGLTYYHFYHAMKEDKGSFHYPPAVLTIVFNFSRLPMNGKTISSLLDPDMWKWLGNLANDYVVHSIDVGTLSDSEWSRFGNGTIGQLIKLLKKKDSYSLMKDVPHMDDLADAFEQLTGEDFAPRIEDNPSGGNDMLEFPNAIEKARRVKMEYAEEGRREGFAQGITEGLEKGIAEGREKGIVEGRAEKNIEVIRNLLQIGQPIEVIAAAVGKSTEETVAIIQTLLSQESKDERKS